MTGEAPGPARRRRPRGPAVAFTLGVAILGITWWLAAPATVSGAEEGVFRFFNRWPDWLEAPVWPVMQFGAVAAVGVFALAAFAVLRDLRPALALVLAGGLAWLGAKAVKSLVGRGRPADYLADVELRPAWEGLGYVSGHAATAFAIATVLGAYVTRPWKIVLWALAVATGILRMYTGAHLPLDVVGGAALGVAAGAVALVVIRSLPSREAGDSD